MSTKYFNLFTLALLALLSGCDRTDYSVQTLGQPTKLNGRTAIETLCSIQHEFHQLPKPVLKEIEYHKEDSRRKQVEFHMTKEKLPAYYQYILTDTAQAWVKQHTQAEISAALMPLILDPQAGAEAAVIITSLASNRTYRTKAYGYHTSHTAEGISNYMYKTRYRSPSDKGSWNSDKAHGFSVPQEVWLSFTVPGEAELYTRGDDNGLRTLNAYLDKLQFDVRYYENGMVLRFEDGHFVKTDTLAEWIEKNPLPPIPEAEEHAALLEKYGKALTILGSYTGHLPTGIAVYELGIDQYWPLNYSQTHTVKELHGPRGKHYEYYEKYSREVREAVYQYSQEVCAK